MIDRRAPEQGARSQDTAKLLHSVIDLETVGDLLRHYPRRYAERGELTSLGRARGRRARHGRRRVSPGSCANPCATGAAPGSRSRSSTAPQEDLPVVLRKGSHAGESRLKTGGAACFAGKVGLFGAGRRRAGS
ncbi:hypothetical protein [Nonomuraea dietziae]|uniref:hypothetical protein n=1 Tax=Nonomuraea dietziae TaxID=65515 RepID=UPI0031D455C4